MTVEKWGREEIKRLVEISSGEGQAELAYQSMCSTIDRQEYARFHYHSVKKLFHDCIGESHSPMNLLKIFTGGGAHARDQLDSCVWEIGAHVTACVQSLHAMVDIFAHAIYFALYNTLDPKKCDKKKLYFTDI